MDAPPPAAVRVGGAGGAAYTVTAVPLDIAIDAAVDPPLDAAVRDGGGGGRGGGAEPWPLPGEGGPLAATAAQRGARSRLLSAVLGLATTQLVEWASWSATLPESAFVDGPSGGGRGGGGGDGGDRGDGYFGATAPPLATLASAPDGSELPGLVRCPDGRQRRLTRAQLESIRDRGTFAIPSERYWGANHTFRLAGWAVRGREPVAATRRARIGRAVDHVTVRLSRRLRGRRDRDRNRDGSADGHPDASIDGGYTRRRVAALSVAVGARHVARGVAGAADVLLGLRRTRPAVGDGAALAARAAAEEAAFVEAAAERQAADASAAGRPRRDTRLVRIVAAVRAAEAAAAAGDGGGRAPAVVAVTTAESDAVAVLDDLLDRLAQSLPPPPLPTAAADGDGGGGDGSGGGGGAASPAAAARVEERAAAAARAAALPSMERAGLADAVRRRVLAAHIAADVMATVPPKLAARRADVEAAVVKEHPRLAAGPRWRAAEVARRLDADAHEPLAATAPRGGTFVRPGPWEEEEAPAGATASPPKFKYAADKIVFAARNKVVAELVAAGGDLADEAADECARVTFWRDHWPAMEAAAAARRVAATTISRGWVRWHTASWTTTASDGKATVEPLTRRTVESTRTGWRLAAAAATAGAIANNGAYLAATTAVSGRYGVRALLTRGPFAVGPPAEAVAAAAASVGRRRDRGALCHYLARSRERQTVTSLLIARWAAVARERQLFEEAPDVGLVPKAAVRWLHYVTNYAVRGGLASVGVCVGFPLATAATLVACALAAVATPVVAVAASAVQYAGCALLWDAFAPDTVGVVGVEPASRAAEARAAARRYRRSGRRAVHLAPLPRRAAQVLALGCGQAVAAAAAAGVYHPAAAAVTVAAAAAAAAARTAVDTVVTAGLRRVGRQPAADTWLAARVSGPGVSASYYYRLDAAVIARGVRGRLEELELSAAADALAAAIAAPADAWAAYVAHTGSAAAGVNGDVAGLVQLAAESSTGRRLAAAAAPRRAALDTAVAARRAALQRATAPHPEKGRLRPAGEPADAAAAVEAAVSRFVLRRLGPLGDAAAAAVAAAAGVPPGDVPALARAVVRDVFGDDFYMPLAVSDETLEIPVSFPPLLACP